MADYDLKYTGQQIDALLDAANELKTNGYIYKGVATPSTNPGTPSERVAYLASEPGTYTNFGGIVIASGLYSLTYAGGTWTGTQMQAGSDIDVVQTTGQSASDVMSQKAVTDEIENINDVVYDNESVDVNIFTKVKGTLNANGGYTHITSEPPSITSYVRIIFIPVNPNERYILTQGVSAGTQYYSIIDNMFDVNADQAQSSIDYATGYNGRVQLSAGSSVVIDVPNDGHYLIVRADEPDGGAAFAPTLVHNVRLDNRVTRLESVVSVKHYVTESYFDNYVFIITNNVVSYTTSPNWASKIIPVADLIRVSLVGTTKSINTLGPSVVFLRAAEPTQANWIQGAEMYGTEETSEYTRRLSTSSFVIPPEATHVLLQNNNKTSTDSYIEIYDIDAMREEINKLQSPVVTVDINGHGDYATIADAVDGTNDGDTILVYPGTYDEIIHAWDKDRHIVGVCRETCILTNGTGRYDTPPLEMNIGSIENMTIIADNYNSTIVDPTTQQERTSYAIHIEHWYPTPFRLLIRHCTIISKWNAAIGAGVRYNQELIIEDCDIKTECVQAWSDGQAAFKSFGAIFFHNDVSASNTQTGHFVLKNCRLRGVNYALSYVPLANRPYLEVEFINNNLCTTNNGVTNIVDNWQPSVTGMIYKSVCCYGNNIAELNA